MLGIVKASNNLLLVALSYTFGIVRATNSMIGREDEVRQLEGIVAAEEASMVAVIGRRRVGKTYLIESTYKNDIAFNLIGQQHAERAIQLQNFADKLQEYTGSALSIKPPTNWREAFTQLKEYLQKRKSKKRRVLFFDELPWLDTHRSGFLSQLSYFWNDWAVNQNIIVVICGSAASWMIEKVINNKAGLHNRVNHLIQLEPFSLAETQLFLKSKKINLDHYQISLIYMAIGGIPYYLDQIVAGETAAQTIQRLCFSKNGFLRREFDNLYSALFDRPEGHVTVIKALAKKWKGLTRNEIIKYSDLTNGGGLTKILEELTRSSFITSYKPFGKKSRQTLYRLTDEYSLFYLTFIEGSTVQKRMWEQLSQKRVVGAWQGYAFESLCLKHVGKIKEALGIAGMYTEESGFQHSGDSTYDGLQIDLLLDRADGAINLCEMKFFNDEVVINKKYAEQLRRRKTAFQYFAKTKKYLFTTLVTTYGLKSNQHSLGLIDHVITLDQLF